MLTGALKVIFPVACNVTLVAAPLIRAASIVLAQFSVWAN
jgi:hypothetical protein